ncbi:MAG: FAS1-like dehydratase domain-containing protein [Dehalococcoidia bacterium]
MGELPQTYLTDEVREYIGRESEPMTAWDLVDASAVRRFTQAIMDPDPSYWDEASAEHSRYGGTVAPPLYPSFAFRREPGSPDPLDRFGEDREYDGLGGGTGAAGLPVVPLPLPRLLNGGVEAEFFQLARVGDRITARSRYADIYERSGRSGTMVLIVTETTYTNQDGVLLLKSRNTIIRR